MKRIHIFLGAAALLLAIGVAFARCWDYSIVDLDDYLYLTAHEQIVEWQGWATVSHAFTDVTEGIWMPLTWLSYALDYIVFGDWYGGFHLHSIAVHFINALLVWRFLFLLFRGNANRTALSLVGALVWAVHPLRCESVVFLASRKDVLSFFWEILALICWAEGSIAALAPNRRRSVALTVLSVLFFVTGSTCKPSVMTFPLLCLLVDAFIYRNVRIMRYLVPVLYMLFLGAFAGWQQKMGGATEDPFNQPLWGRILGAAAAFGIYVRNFLWPQELAPQCVKTWPALPRFLLPGLAISTVWGYCLWRRARFYWDRRATLVRIGKHYDLPVELTSTAAPDHLFVGATWFLIAVGPMLGIASFGYHSFADRFTYIPAVGLSIMLIFALDRAIVRVGAKLAYAVAALAVVALVGVSWHQTGYWKDDFTLFSHTLEVDGEHNGCAHGVLANWYFEYPHDLDRSVEEFEKALASNVNYVIPCYPVYLIALLESGHSDRIRDRIKLFEDYVNKTFGPERCVHLWAGDMEMTPHEASLRSLYYACKLIEWMDDRKNLPTIEDAFDRISGEAFAKDQTWQYIRWKYHLLKGDKEGAEKWLKQLFDPHQRKIGYVKFRYLQRGLRESDFGQK